MKASVFPVLLSVASLVSAGAATISWTSSPYTVSGAWGQTLNTGLFVTTGTQVVAENVGGPALTFDGIDFSAGTINFGGAYGGFHDAASGLSKTGTYGASGTGGTVNLSGLTVGASYRVQAFVYDGRGDAGITGRTVSFDGVDMGQYAKGIHNVTWGDGLLVTGTFMADSETQVFNIEAFYNGSSKGGQLNALLVHQTAIPEVSVVLLGCASLPGLLRRRR